MVSKARISEIITQIKAWDPETESISVVRDLVAEAGGVAGLDDDPDGGHFAGILVSAQAYEDYVDRIMYVEGYGPIWAVDHAGMALVGDGTVVVHVNELEEANQ